MAKCYILASISNVLQHQMQDMELALDIIVRFWVCNVGKPWQNMTKTKSY